MVAPTPASTGRIFISYRREETDFAAGWLFDRLANHLGPEQVVLDVASIQLGDDFIEAITSEVESCQVLLALIGKRWLTITDEHGRRRLDNPEDFVRLEIEAALKRNVRVIPILVSGARMPKADELPASLTPLVRRQALELSHSRFDFDTSQLLKVLDKALEVSRLAAQPEAESPQESIPRPTVEMPPEPIPSPTVQTNASTRTRIFISYSHKDERWLRQLQLFLRPLQRDGRIDLWDDSRIKAGQQWRKEITEAIGSAKVVILLVTAEFMASDFVYGELPPILEAAKKRGVRILPVIVEWSSFQDSKLAQFQAINSPDKPLVALRKDGRDEVFMAVFKAVKDSLSS